MLRIICACWIAITVLCVYGNPVKVACIGNSITYGATITPRDSLSYPAQLQQMLGSTYDVGNFGKSGATLLRRGHRPYNEQPEYFSAIGFAPDVAVIHLGINDTDPRDWPNFNADFVSDYMQLISDIRQSNPNVRILIAKLTPIRASHPRFKSGTRDWRNEINAAIEVVAQATGCELIDFNAPLVDRQNLIRDGVHPDAEGAFLLAATVKSAITGDYGGLRLSPVYQSGMVLQRNRPLTIEGWGNVGSRVELTLDGKTYSADVSPLGKWKVVSEPLTDTDRRYTMTVSDGIETLSFDNIYVGELWMASGQSNMELPLAFVNGGAETIAGCSDSLLRIFNMEALARTNAQTWTEEAVDCVDRLEHFKPTCWQPVTPDNAGAFSAVAYHFAKELRDSLNVPVGVICNAVGGSPTESWIDVNTLELGMPDILVDWLGNDYVQPWVQKRAKENLGNHAGSRHPYEPSYLFSAGIRPLGSLTLAGVIWYQGESNAHNIEVHERLFEMFVDSWRRHFHSPQMPFYFVQLSSLNRPSWPQFRDSQRLLAQRIPYTGMVVSSDCGDSTEVHYTRKAEIGQRLAKQALRHEYGFDLEYSGPEPIQAISTDSAVLVTFDHAKGLSPSDGNLIHGFEIAYLDGLYYPAYAEVVSECVIRLTNPEVVRPTYVRYGWEPFTRANLINAAGLPASTFKMKCKIDSELK